MFVYLCICMCVCVEVGRKGGGGEEERSRGGSEKGSEERSEEGKERRNTKIRMNTRERLGSTDAQSLLSPVAVPRKTECTRPLTAGIRPTCVNGRSAPHKDPMRASRRAASRKPKFGRFAPSREDALHTKKKKKVRH